MFTLDWILNHDFSGCPFSVATFGCPKASTLQVVGHGLDVPRGFQRHPPLLGLAGHLRATGGGRQVGFGRTLGATEGLGISSTFRTDWWFETISYFFHSVGISSSQLTFIFVRGVETTQ